MMPSYQLSYPSPVKGTKIGSINALTQKEKEVEPLSGDIVVDMRGRRIMLEAHCSMQCAAHAAVPSTQPRALGSNDGSLLHSLRRQAYTLRSAPSPASSAPGGAPQLAEDSGKGSGESEVESDDESDDESEAASDNDSRQSGGKGPSSPEGNSHAARPGSLPPHSVSPTVRQGPHAHSSALSHFDSASSTCRDCSMYMPAVSVLLA